MARKKSKRNGEESTLDKLWTWTIKLGYPAIAAIALIAAGCRINDYCSSPQRIVRQPERQKPGIERVVQEEKPEIAVDNQTYPVRNTPQNYQTPTAPVQAIPTPVPQVKKHIIVLDAGHGGTSAPGACYGDLRESDVTLLQVRRIGEILREKGYDVQFTRENDSFVSLDERVAIANRLNPQVFVSVHCNSLERDDVEGLETYHLAGNSEGQNLANYIQSSLLTSLAGKETDRGVKTEKYRVLKIKGATALVEIGFMSHKKNREKIIQNPKTAEGIADGIIGYLEAK